MNDYHIPVLLNETIEYLNVKEGGKYIDATLGGGGHTEAILKRGGRVLALDVDSDAIDFCCQKFSLAGTTRNNRKIATGTELTVVQANFKDIDEIAAEFGFLPADGIIADLGVSSHQLEDPKYGISFQSDSPLDMRMDPNLEVTAEKLLNSLPERNLNELFSRYGEEPRSRSIARDIVNSRVRTPIRTTGQLVDIVKKYYPRRGRLNPATKVFQALRIVVNSELKNLEEFLQKSEMLINNESRIVIISFHSLEDRLVKNFFNDSNQLRPITDGIVTASEEELEINRRSRSAKLRVAEKIPLT